MSRQQRTRSQLRLRPHAASGARRDARDAFLFASDRNDRATTDATRRRLTTTTTAQAEADAVNLLAGAKTQSNPENAVGVLQLAGKTPRVLTTPTQDLGAVLNSVHGVKIEGEINVCAGVQVAHLALKHRQNKHQRMRIVLFVGSPLRETIEDLKATGKKLRKCNVAVDVVSFGDVEANRERLDAFVASVNKNNNSNLVVVEPGANLSDVLCGTAIFNQDGAAAGSGFAAAAAAAQSQAAMQGLEGMGDMGDMGDDPALMMALRISLEEERARQEAAAAAGASARAAAEEGVAASEGAGSADTSPVERRRRSHDARRRRFTPTSARAEHGSAPERRNRRRRDGDRRGRRRRRASRRARDVASRPHRARRSRRRRRVTSRISSPRRRSPTRPFDSFQSRRRSPSRPRHFAPLAAMFASSSSSLAPALARRARARAAVVARAALGVGARVRVKSSRRRVPRPEIEGRGGRISSA